MAYTNIEKRGLYKDGFWERSRKRMLKKTWRNFKDHSARALKETQRSSRISNTEGYAENVKSAQANAVLSTKIQQDHTLALANLATASQADRTSFALLMKTIAELSTQVFTVTAKLATAHSENDRLKNRDIVRPQPSTDIVRPVIRPHPIKICSRTAMCF